MFIQSSVSVSENVVDKSLTEIKQVQSEKLEKMTTGMKSDTEELKDL